jgi:hypothetical protein
MLPASIRLILTPSVATVVNAVVLAVATMVRFVTTTLIVLATIRATAITAATQYRVHASVAATVVRNASILSNRLLFVWAVQTMASRVRRAVLMA